MERKNAYYVKPYTNVGAINTDDISFAWLNPDCCHVILSFLRDTEIYNPLNILRLLGIHSSENDVLLKAIPAYATSASTACVERLFLRAIRHGHNGAVETILGNTKHALISTRCKTTGLTPLMLAAALGHVDMTKVLLAASSPGGIGESMKLFPENTHNHEEDAVREGEEDRQRIADNGEVDIELLVLNESQKAAWLLACSRVLPGFPFDSAPVSALGLAAFYGHYGVIELLLQALRTPDTHRVHAPAMNPLHLACVGGSVNSVRLLLTYDFVDPLAFACYGQEPTRYNALQLASLYGHAECAKILLSETSINPHSVAPENGLAHELNGLPRQDENAQNQLTALALAIVHRHPSVVEVLLADARVDPSNPLDLPSDHQGPRKTALMMTCEAGGCPATVRLLLNHSRSDFRIGEDRGRTSLLLAIQARCHETVATLLSCHSCDPLMALSALTSSESTYEVASNYLLVHEKYLSTHMTYEYAEKTFLSACGSGHTQIARFLLLSSFLQTSNEEDNASFVPLIVSMSDNSWLQALASTSLNVRLGVMEMLLQECEEYLPSAVVQKWKSEYWHESVANACRAGNKEGIRYLLNIKTHLALSAESVSTTSPLHISCVRGDLEIVQLLLDDLRFDPMVKEPRTGFYPIHRACEGGFAEIVSLLLRDSRVNPSIEVMKGMDHSLFRRHGSSYNLYKVNALLLAVEKGHVAVVHTLIEDGRVDPGFTTDYGYTPLMLAAVYNHVEIVHMLLNIPQNSRKIRSFGLDPCIADHFGRNALMLAAASKNSGAVRALLNDGRINPADTDDYGRNALMMRAMADRNTSNSSYSDARRRRERTLPGETEQGGAADNLEGLMELQDDVVALLLADGRVDPTAVDRYGKNALMLASEIGHEDVVSLLLKDGRINPLTRDFYGRNAFIFAQTWRRENVIGMLERAATRMDSALGGESPGLSEIALACG